MRNSELSGKRVSIIRMEDPYTDLRPGSKGTIVGEDDMGHIHVKWDNGSSLSLIPEVDEYEIIEESKKIQRFLEFVNSVSYVGSKLEELEDMVKSFTEGRDLMYHWENKNDEAVVITFQFDGVAVKYDFDIDEGVLTKTFDDQLEFEEMVESEEEGLEMIEKDIQIMLGISEGIKIKDVSSLIVGNKYKITIPSYDEGDLPEETKIEVIAKNNGKYIFKDLEHNFTYDRSFNMLDDYEIEEISERVKAQRYKGRKIPGKYLTKNPGKMKKEIDTFRGKKEYKKDWDADYTSGKGGVGKRVKTKKSASTKAYQRMFGDK